MRWKSPRSQAKAEWRELGGLASPQAECRTTLSPPISRVLMTTDAGPSPSEAHATPRTVPLAGRVVSIQEKEFRSEEPNLLRAALQRLGGFGGMAKIREDLYATVFGDGDPNRRATLAASNSCASCGRRFCNRPATGLAKALRSLRRTRPSFRGFADRSRPDQRRASPWRCSGWLARAREWPRAMSCHPACKLPHEPICSKGWRRRQVSDPQ